VKNSDDKTSSYQSWIDIGYESFAQSGPEGIKVEVMARKSGVSKSSFYHYFGDHEIFMETLLDEHFYAAERLAAEARQCKTFVPGFVDLVMKHKPVVQFQRHLRVNRENLDFQFAYQRAGDMVKNEILGVWAEFIGVAPDMDMANSLYVVISDLFFERVREATFNPVWIDGLIDEIKNIVQGLLERSHARKKLFHSA
jgi:AcrR family transcriptional regulator